MFFRPSNSTGPVNEKGAPITPLFDPFFSVVVGMFIVFLAMVGVE